jgi:hypothetical protein
MFKNKKMGGAEFKTLAVSLFRKIKSELKTVKILHMQILLKEKIFSEGTVGFVFIMCGSADIVSNQRKRLRPNVKSIQKAGISRKPIYLPNRTNGMHCKRVNKTYDFY